MYCEIYPSLGDNLSIPSFRMIYCTVLSRLVLYYSEIVNIVSCVATGHETCGGRAADNCCNLGTLDGGDYVLDTVTLLGIDGILGGQGHHCGETTDGDKSLKLSSAQGMYYVLGRHL